MTETHLAVFKGKQIRRTLYKNELNSYWGTICTPLEIMAPDGKMRDSNCANTEGIFRIIHVVPSPKVEPFKRWLANVEVSLQDETAWMSQLGMAERFQTTVPHINIHVNSVCDEGKFSETVTIKDYLIVRHEGARHYREQEKTRAQG